MVPVIHNKSLLNENTWRIESSCSYFAQPKTLDELKEVLSWALGQGNLPLFFLGAGSNVLFPSRGLKALVISLRSLQGLEFSLNSSRTRWQSVALAGTSKMELFRHLFKHKLPESIFLAGIPGTLGGGVAMNAGVSLGPSPREFCEITEAVEVLHLTSNLSTTSTNFSLSTYGPKDLQWGYRSCKGFQPGVITRVFFGGPYHPQEAVVEQVRAANSRRVTTQPLSEPNCGSVFRNPEGHKAAQLIEACGLKGFQIGDARVSTKHSNFIVNSGQARSEEILELMNHIQKEVLSRFSVKLEPEVVLAEESLISFGIS